MPQQAAGSLIFQAVLDSAAEYEFMVQCYQHLCRQRRHQPPQPTPVRAYLNAKGGVELMDNGEMRFILKRQKS